MLPTATLAAAGPFLALASPGSRLPQLYCYLVSVTTGYVAVVMLEEELGTGAAAESQDLAPPH